MIIDKNNYFFSQFANSISIPVIHSKSFIPFQQHPRFSTLVDILCRKNSHHAILDADFSADSNIYFLQALLQHFKQENISLLHSTKLFYLDFNQFIFHTNNKDIENNFVNIIDHLNQTKKYFIFALANFDLFSSSDEKDNHGMLRLQLQKLATHPKSRFIIFMNSTKFHYANETSHQFEYVALGKITSTEMSAIMRSQRNELENFHQIKIPDEIIEHTLALTKRYLSSQHIIEKAVLLLDSSAARTSSLEKTAATKPILSLSILLETLSNWTQIPSDHLQSNSFEYSEFNHEMQQKIFSQEPAVNLLGQVLQHSQTYLNQHNKPFFSLLFAGPEHSGKKTTAIALTEFIFKQTNMLYFVSPISQNFNSILEIKLHSYEDKKCITLKELIKKIPYAVIMFENFHLTSENILYDLQEILSTGFLYDEMGEQYHFQQSTILLSTTLGSYELTEIAKSFVAEEETDEMNLLQLVMFEQKHKSYLTPHYSPQEIADKVANVIINHLPSALCQMLTIIPFLPLDRAAIEKIIRKKLKQLSHILESEHEIELGYAPDVIQYLVNNIMGNEQNNFVVDTQKSLNQFYFAVEQAILSQTNRQQNSNQLFLQLNETGQILNCDWLTGLENFG